MLNYRRIQKLPEDGKQIRGESISLLVLVEPSLVGVRIYLIIDDPHSEQDALSETAMDNAYEWYTSGPRQRLTTGRSYCYCYDHDGQQKI